MLIASGADLNIKNHFGASALNWAVRNGEIQFELKTEIVCPIIIV